jgi:hypothetical protein
MADKKQYFQTWYQKHKQELSEKRKKRYQTDSAYREARKSAHRLYQQLKRATVPEDHSITFNQAAEKLGVTPWRLRWWLGRDYFPSPAKICGKLWFTDAQVQLIASLRDQLNSSGPRISRAKKLELENLVNLIYANWN